MLLLHVTVTCRQLDWIIETQYLLILNWKHNWICETQYLRQRNISTVATRYVQLSTKPLDLHKFQHLASSFVLTCDIVTSFLFMQCLDWIPNKGLNFNIFCLILKWLYSCLRFGNRRNFHCLMLFLSQINFRKCSFVQIQVFRLQSNRQLAVAGWLDILKTTWKKPWWFSVNNLKSNLVFWCQ